MVIRDKLSYGNAVFLGGFMKKILCVVFSFAVLALFSCTAREAAYNGSEYSFSVNYSETVNPGDIVYINMSFVAENYDYKVPEYATAELIRLSSGKSYGKRELYTVRQNPPVMFAAIPLSTYLESGEFALEVHYKEANGREMKFSLPVVAEPKEFVEEVLYLNATNTAIKTDNSPKRAAQIDRLNDILYSVNKNAIYYTSNFVYPVESTRRTAFFGDRRTYQYDTGSSSTSLHYGIDFGVPTGTPVYACGDGKVVLVEDRVSTGWSIVIEHLPGLYSLYYHLDSTLIEEGMLVKAGEQIGFSGATGLATGPHLHWEVRFLGEAINPDFFVENRLF